jgi:hypothetical protein
MQPTINIKGSKKLNNHGGNLVTFTLLRIDPYPHWQWIA